jgi:hypothetical protein
MQMQMQSHLIWLLAETANNYLISVLTADMPRDSSSVDQPTSSLQEG